MAYHCAALTVSGVMRLLYAQQSGGGAGSRSKQGWITIRVAGHVIQSLRSADPYAGLHVRDSASRRARYMSTRMLKTAIRRSEYAKVNGSPARSVTG